VTFENIKRKIIHINHMINLGVESRSVDYTLGTMAAAAVCGAIVQIATNKLPYRKQLAAHTVCLTAFVAVDLTVAYIQGHIAAQEENVRVVDEFIQQWAPAPGPVPPNTKVN
jgi:hypothetical protein